MVNARVVMLVISGLIVFSTHCQAVFLNSLDALCKKMRDRIAETSYVSETKAYVSNTFAGALSLMTVEREGFWARDRFYIATMDVPILVFHRGSNHVLPKQILSYKKFEKINGVDVDEHVGSKKTEKLGFPTFFSNPDTAKKKIVGVRETLWGRYLFKLKLPAGKRILIIKGDFGSFGVPRYENEIVSDSLDDVEIIGVEQLPEYY